MTITTPQITIQNQQQKFSIKGPFSYSESLALSLILYAQQNKKFNSWFKRHVTKQPLYIPIKTKTVFTLPDKLAVLLPANLPSAIKRTQWLTRQIQQNNLPASLKAAALLSSWKQSQTLTVPKQLIVGVFQVAIPGITLGKIDKKFPLTVIIRTPLAHHHTLAIANQINKAVINLLAKSFESAGGDAQKLEPEIFDWFFDDRRLLFYSADEKQLINIENELDYLDISYAAIQENNKTAVLAISPAVNRAYQSLVWKIKPLSNHSSLSKIDGSQTFSKV